MNRKQIAFFNSMVTVSDYCKSKPLSWAKLPNFEPLLNDLDTHRQQISALASGQLTNISGIAVNKKQLRLELVLAAAETSSRLVAYAKAQKNVILQNEVAYSEYELKRQPDIPFEEICQLLYTKAQLNLEALAPYLITAQTQAALLSAITAFSSAQPAPRQGQVDQTQTTRQIELLFQQASNILDDMDALVEMVRRSDAEFYTGYTEARHIIVRGVRTLALKIQVSDSQNGSSLKGVHISIYKNGHGNTEPAPGDKAILQKVTAEKGGCQVSNLASGAYLACAEKAGYTTKNQTVYINEGEMTMLNLQLIPLN